LCRSSFTLHGGKAQQAFQCSIAANASSGDIPASRSRQATRKQAFDPFAPWMLGIAMM
jgi:hypothetical protein